MINIPEFDSSGASRTAQDPSDVKSIIAGKGLHDSSHESMQMMAWATAQNLAMTKLAIFHKMAKAIGDQQ